MRNPYRNTGISKGPMLLPYPSPARAFMMIHISLTDFASWFGFLAIPFRLRMFNLFHGKGRLAKDENCYWDVEPMKTPMDMVHAL